MNTENLSRNELLQELVKLKGRNKKLKHLHKKCKRRLDAAFKYSAIGMALVSPEGRFVEVNPALCKMLEFPEEVLLLKTIQDITHPDDLEESMKYVQQTLNGKIDSYQIDKRYIKSSEEIIWVNLTVSIIRNKHGNPKHFISQIIDSTDRILVVEELKKSNLYNRSLLEASIDPFVTIGEDGTISDVNKATENATGYNRKELIGTDFSKYFTIAEKARTGYEKIFKEGKVRDFALELQNKNGETTSVMYNASVYKDENERVVGAFVAARDITKRRQVEKALRESEQKVKAKLNSLLEPEGDLVNLELSDIIDTEEVQKLMNEFYELTHIGIGLIDIEGKILVGCGWQDACLKFHRLNKDTCKNCIDSDIYLSNGVSQGEYKMYKCKNNMWDISTPIIIGGKHLGNIFLGQFFFEDEVPDVSFFTMQAKRYGFNEVKYLDAIDKVPRWTKETVDHTMKFYSKLGMMLSKLSYSNLKLAKTVEDLKRTKEALSESELQLKELNFSKDKFFSIIAHDLKSPLSGFIKLSEDLTKNFMELSPNDVKEYSRGLYQSSTYLYNLLENLLEWSRMQRNMSEVKPERAKLLQQVLETKKILKLQLEQKQITLLININPNIEVIADKNMLMTILRNLISNAIKFSYPNSNIEIYTLTTTTKAVLNIKDYGKGIPQSKQDNIFSLGETFTQLGTKNEKGTGLGLLLCKELIERNNGRLWFISSEMRETIFSFSLPTS